MGSKAKTEDGKEQGDGSPKKKKHKVVLKETIEEPEEEPQGKPKAETRGAPEAKAKEGKCQFKAELVRALWVHTTEMCLMHKAQERVVTECAKISKSVAPSPTWWPTWI